MIDAIDALHEEAIDLRTCHGLGEIVALPDLAAQGMDLPCLLDRLDALRDDRQIEGMAQAGHRVDDRSVLAVATQARDEGPVDLELVHREALEIGQAGVARAEVVDGQLYA